MNYEAFEPSENLSSFVKCYWTLESAAEEPAQRQTVVPDGCMEMIFHYGDLYRQYLSDGSSIIQPRCFVFGQLAGPLEIEPTGASGIFSVRFHPDGFTPFATIPVREMENRAVPLEELFGDAGTGIAQRVLNAGTTGERIGLIEKFLSELLESDETIDRVVKSTVDTIITANGQLSVGEISGQMNVNRRSLERKFAATVGLSPKQLSRIIRLQATLRMLLSHRVTSLTALAYEGEYYDQAHFTRDFKEFTGFTPKEFYSGQLKMTSFFIGT